MTQNRTVTAALSALIIIQAVMVLSLFAGVEPHPPSKTPLFGIAPFIGAAISAAAAALVMGPEDTRGGRALSVLAALCALVSFGPQKYFDPSFGLIWPGVVTGQIAVLAVFSGLFLPARVTHQSA